MSDDHTSQAWGIYGGVINDHVINKNIKRIASEGATLTNVFCTNAICVPSRASILTGRFSHQNGVYTLSEGLDPDSMNIAKAFQQNNYETAIVGKWHLKQKPAGFDYYNVLPGQGRYHNPILKDKNNWDDKGKIYNGFSADVIGDESVKWLKNRDSEKPFLLMTHFKATHEPFDYPDRYKDYLKEVEIPEPKNLYQIDPETSNRKFPGQQLSILGSRYVTASTHKNPVYPGLPFDLKGLDRNNAQKKIYQKFIKDFIRSGAAIDDNIGKLLNYLDAEGLSENTIVIYTSDQGYFLGEHGYFDKRMIYDESARMPFVIKYPNEIKPGIKNEDLILNLDFPSLLADYAGFQLPSSFQGRSFRENIKGNTPSDWRTSMYYRYWLHQVQRPAHFGIRDHRYILAYFYGKPMGMPGAHEQITNPSWEFYDLVNDPEQNNNAIDDPVYRQTIDSLKIELSALRSQVGDKDDLEVGLN